MSSRIYVHKFPGYIGIVACALALGFASTAAAISYVLLALAVGAALLAVVIGIWGVAGLANALMLSAAFTVSMVSVRVGEVTMADVLLGAAAIPILILCARKRSTSSPPPGPMRWHFSVIALIFLVIIGGLVGTFSASDQIGSLDQLARFAASSMLVVLVFWLWKPPRPTLELLCWVLVLGASTNAVLGLFLERLGDRTMGLSGHPNLFALACSLAIGTTLGLTFGSGGGVRQRVGLTLCLAALGVGVVSSGSRAGLASLGVTAITFLLVTNRWKLIGLGALATGLVIIAINLNLLAIGELNAVNRIKGDSSTVVSDRSRVEMAQEAVDAIRLNPLIGGGFETAKASHSIYLQLWGSAGVFGLAFAIGLAVLTLKILLDARRRSDLLATGLASSYIGYLTAGGAFSNILWDRYVWIHLAVLLTLVAQNESPPTLSNKTLVNVPEDSSARLAKLPS